MSTRQDNVLLNTQTFTSHTHFSVFFSFYFREMMLRFCDDEHDRCLVVPESMKLDNVIPSKLGKGKLLVFIKLAPVALKMETIMTDVSI